MVKRLSSSFSLVHSICNFSLLWKSLRLKDVLLVSQSLLKISQKCKHNFQLTSHYWFPPEFVWVNKTFLPDDSNLLLVCQVRLSTTLSLTDLNFKPTGFHAKLEHYSNYLEAPLSLSTMRKTIQGKFAFRLVFATVYKVFETNLSSNLCTPWMLSDIHANIQ